MGSYELSWWELAEFLRHECYDSESALYRQLNPDWRETETVDTLLLRYIAQAVTDLRWLTAVPLFGDEVPDGFGPVKFKFPGDDEDQDDEVESRDRAESARHAADEIRDELFA